jgi:hypothetical protein
MNYSTSVPEAFIAIGRNRLKIYNGKSVFIKDGEEFQIELFNPTTKTIGAKIIINGNSISNSLLILKPGERSYLERYLDDDKKFLFETYEVENSKAAKAAIKENGIIKVEFYNEKAPAITATTFHPSTGTITIGPNYPYNPIPNIYYSTGTGTTGGHDGVCCTNSAFYCSTTTNSSSFNTFTSPGIFTRELDSSKSEDSKTLETGRIEKGATSDQSFSNYYGEFESFCFSSVDYKLLPESQKPVEIKELRSYCPNCRTRIKKASWNFCVSCGEKL